MVVTKLFGGLANILLQHCACLGYAAKHKIPYAIPTVTTNKRWKHYKFPGICYEDADTRNFFHYREPAIEYDKRPYDITFQDIPYHENILLEGHFLSHKYWWDYKDEILPMFGFEWQPIDDIFSVHLRAKDYRAMQEYLPIMDLNYYQRAINFMINQTGIRKIMVFGDEPELNKRYFTATNFPTLSSIKFSEDRNELEDIQFMSCFTHQVIANSTYSLFAYYLNKNPQKICVAPLGWYGNGFGKVDTRDMYAPNTILK